MCIRDRAKNVEKLDSALELYNSTQSDGIEKFNSIEKCQVEVINLLFALKETNDSIQERLKNLEVQEGATGVIRAQEGATIVIKDTIPPPPLREINKEKKLEQKIEFNAKTSPTGDGSDKIKGTLLTTVPNSPVRNIMPNEKSQSNPKVPINVITNYFSPINLSGLSIIPANSMKEMEAQKEDKMEAQNGDVQKLSLIHI